MLIRSTPFPAPLSTDDAAELAEILGTIVAASAESAAPYCGVSASYLVTRSTREPVMDALTGQFLKHNKDGHPPIESALRATAWLTATLIRAVRETRRQLHERR